MYHNNGSSIIKQRQSQLCQTGDANIREFGIIRRVSICGHDG